MQKLIKAISGKTIFSWLHENSKSITPADEQRDGRLSYSLKKNKTIKFLHSP